MNARRLMIGLTTLVLVTAVFVGIANRAPVTANTSTLPELNKTTLENVRDYASAVTPNGANFAIEAGLLYAGQPNNWQRVILPEGVLANAVAVDARNDNAVYVGAANELAIYRTTDGGANWLRVPLSDQFIGAVTDLAVDGANRLLYVGTDTAGVFRLRDVGSSMISGGHMPLDEAVVEMAADSTGAGLAFVRTASTLFRSMNSGLNWAKVDSLPSTPTAVEVLNTTPASVFVGTVDLGLWKSADGIAWMSANDGLGMTPGARLQVDALAVDPLYPNVMYVATSYLYGSSTLHRSPVGVSLSATAGRQWMPLTRDGNVSVVELLPLSGTTGAVYALTNSSRTPFALGSAPVAIQATQQPVASEADLLAGAGVMSAWIVAMIAAIWLSILVATSLRSRPVELQPAAQTVQMQR